MPLPQDSISDISRHLSYEVTGLYSLAPGAGGSLTLGNLGIRYFGPYGSLLYRLNLLRPVEEAKLTGQATGAIYFTGSDPVPGDTITATINGGALGSPVVATVTVLPGMTLLGLAAALATAIMLVPEFQAAGFYALADYGGGPYSQQKIATPVVSINAPQGVTSFTLTATYTGTTVPQVFNTPRPVSPYISYNIPSGTQVIYGYVPVLNYMEASEGGAVANLSISEANGVKTRMDELDLREQLYDKWVDKLANYLGVPSNRRPVNGGYSSGASW